MSRFERLADGIVAHARLVLVVTLVLTAVVGAGVTTLETDSSLAQFESESPETGAAEYVAANLTPENEVNATRAHVVVRGENVLTRESLLDSLAFQRAVREDAAINATLAETEPIVGVENVVASSAILGEQIEALERRAADVERRAEALNETARTLTRSVDETVSLQWEYEALNASASAGEIGDAEYDRRAAALEADLAAARERGTENLTASEAERFERELANARLIQADRFELERAYEAGELSAAAYERRDGAYADGLETVRVDATSGVLGDTYDELAAERDRLEAERAALEAAGQPPLAAQIEALESMSAAEFDAALETALAGEGRTEDALELLPSSYDPGTDDAAARVTVFTQRVDGDGTIRMGALGGDVVDAQLELRDLAEDRDESSVVFGLGVVGDEIDRSMADSLVLVAPLALAFVVVALFVAYRDPIDIALGVAGIVAVLLWTFGFAGWAGVTFNQLFVAVPVLLIGLSIDYAIHVFMRHREQRETPRVSEERAGSEATREQREAPGAAPDDVRASMGVALAGVGVALAWVTATTAFGFLSNVVSPIGPIREFGVVSAVGIGSALVVFGALIPAAKVEIDSALEARGFDRRKRAFGTGGGRFEAALSVGSALARRAPAALLLVVLVVTAGGVYGAAQVDTTFDQTDFRADSPPAWTQSLPEPFAPGEYQAKDDLAYVDERFQREGANARVLVRGAVTDPETLDRVAAATETAAASNLTYVHADGTVAVESPLSVMRSAAASDESFNATFTIADTDGDRVPDRNLGTVYDDLFDADAAAAGDVLHRTGEGEYEAFQIAVGVSGSASFGEAAADARAVAGAFDDGNDARWSAVPTGAPVVNHAIEQDVFETVLESLLLTLGAVFILLTLAYWAAGHGPFLGLVTVLPVVLAVCWILGTMSLLGLPFNVLTGMITSLTIGLGVDYSVHVSSRYTLELRRQGTVWGAMRTTITGTGGALLGSAATTVGGFGVLALAILPVLRQFGLITAVTIVYSFLASVVVLPTLLACWTRYVGPDVPFDAPAAGTAATASDGGRDGAGASQGRDE